MQPASIIKFMSYNVNYSRRAVDEYSEYGWESRKNDVYKLIQGADRNIIFLQEILSQNRDEVQKSLSDYRWYFEMTNSRNGVCCNGIGIKDSFRPGQERKQFSYNFNVFEKGAEKVLGIVIDDLCLVNVHCPMEEKARMAMAENLDKCLPLDQEFKQIIFAGDFNSFPDCRGEEQIETIAKVTRTVRISDSAVSETTKQIATRSFQAYPYDVVPEQALNLPGKIDHIFVKDLTLETTPVVLDARYVEGKTFAPSDHYPIVTSLK
ncbi:MAG: endonuclease/exonuclease/phosphatase family protein [Chlamydiales bacterium]|nr:endonuclease/exonuclease/phosphatase family protein [Chlamydiales bacterium]